MKRAVVWRALPGRWVVMAGPEEQYLRTPALSLRIPVGFYEERFPTHEAALAHALAEVGLTEKKEDRSA